jgi:DegV family protein with EDD domain
MIKIYSDSAIDYSLEEAKALGITIIPIKLTIDNKEYRDYIDITKEKFFKRLETAKEFPKTSQISPYEFEKALEEEKEEVILFTMSSKLSGTYNSAVLGLSDRTNISIVDTLSVSIGMQNLVSVAIKYIKEGKSRKDIVDILNNIKHKLRLCASLDTLENLKKGGRINSAVAFFGELLNIKPIVELVDGKVHLLSKGHGIKNSLSKLDDIVKKNINLQMPYMMAYTGLSRKNLDTYLAQSSIGLNNKNVTSIGAVIGTHIGPNGVAISYFEK